VLPVVLVWNRSRRAWRAMLELAADDEDICIFGSLGGNVGVPEPPEAPSRHLEACKNPPIVRAKLLKTLRCFRSETSGLLARPKAAAGLSEG
jgi:hypothetical protein